MTTFYVGPGGSDAAAGTSYALRWLTLAKALGAAGIASGDTLYLTPGTYRATITVAMISATAETLIIGDVDGSHTSGVAGPVIWTAYTTNDTTAPASATTLTLAGRDFLTFRNIMFVSGNAFPGAVNANTATSTDIKFTDCAFAAWFTAAIQMTVGAGVSANWTLDRCYFMSNTQAGANGCVDILLNRHTADYDANILVRNSIFIGAGGANNIRIGSTGAGTGKGGGVDVLNCTLLGAVTAVFAADANLSTSTPCTVNNCYINANVALNANTSGQITESYNFLNANTARTNVTAGTGSVAGNAYAPMMDFGQGRIWGGVTRPFMTPMAGSALSGFGAGASPPTVDLLNRDRPSGGAITMAVGALERHDFGTKETGTIDTGGLAVRLTGPGDHQFVLPVTAVSTTVSLKVYYDTNHATTNPPQAQLMANNLIGYAGETVTAAASTGSFLTLTFAAFTPTVAGYVILRLRSRSAAATGYAIYDSVSVT